MNEDTRATLNVLTTRLHNAYMKLADLGAEISNIQWDIEQLLMADENHQASISKEAV